MESLEVSLHLFQQFGTQDVGLDPRANGSYQFKAMAKVSCYSCQRDVKKGEIGSLSTFKLLNHCPICQVDLLI